MSAYDVFISYSDTNDGEAGRQLVAALRDAGISCFLYGEVVADGRDSEFLPPIDRALRSAKVVVCLLSVASRDSRYIQSELKIANDLRTGIIPIILGKVKLSTELELLLGIAQYRQIEGIVGNEQRLIDLVVEELNRKRPLPEQIDEAQPQYTIPEPEGKSSDAIAPYVGPRPFDERTAALFVGREKECRWLIDGLERSRITMIYAPSGAGKSSLLMAKLIPQLTRMGYQVLTTRSGPPRIGRVAVEDIPEDDPVCIFSYSLMLELSGREDFQPNRSARLAPFISSIARTTDGFRGKVIVLDQFEEMFFEAYESRYADRIQFVKDVQAALDADPTLRVMISFRKEYLADVQRLFSVLPAGSTYEIPLARMDSEAAKQAISVPVQSFYQFSDDALETLVNQLRRTSVKTSSGRMVRKEAEFIEMAHLQVVCLRLWNNLPDGAKHIDMDVLKNASGIEGETDEFVANALGDYYEECVNQTASATGLSPEWIFLGCSQFVSPSETRIQLPSINGRAGRLPDSAVRQLENKFLLRRVYRGADSWYELSHDLLIDSIVSRRSKATMELLFAADHLDRVLQQATEGGSLSLENFFDRHGDLQTECKALNDQNGLFKEEAEILFRSSLATGLDVYFWGQGLQQNYPEDLHRVLSEAFVARESIVRENAVDVACKLQVRELLPSVVQIAVDDPNHDVRVTASRGMATWDEKELYAKLLEKLEEETRSDSREAKPVAGKSTIDSAMESLSIIRLRSVLTEGEARQFDSVFKSLRQNQRRSLTLTSWRLRLFDSWSLLITVFIFSAAFSAVPAVIFKMWPSYFNWGISQHAGHFAIGAFQGAVASFFWAGFITLGITIYYAVFADAKSPKSAIQPFLAVVMGALSGVFASLFITAAILGVFNPNSLLAMHWITEDYRSNGVTYEAFFVTRFAWVYLITGAGLGAGLGFLSNSIRASRTWRALLDEHTEPIDSRALFIRLYGAILKISLPRLMWLLIPIAMSAVVAYFFPDLSLQAGETSGSTSSQQLIFGLIGDCSTQFVGATFGVCGALLGVLIVRNGFAVRPSRIASGASI